MIDHVHGFVVTCRIFLIFVQSTSHDSCSRLWKWHHTWFAVRRSRIVLKSININGKCHPKLIEAIRCGSSLSTAVFALIWSLVRRGLVWDGKSRKLFPRISKEWTNIFRNDFHRTVILWSKTWSSMDYYIIHFIADESCFQESRRNRGHGTCLETWGLVPNI